MEVSGIQWSICSIGLFFLAVNCVLASGSEPCGRGQFLDRISGECRECSPCKKRNHIIRVPCTADSDTICGPFYEFSFDQGGEEPGDSLGDEGPTPEEEGGNEDGGTQGYDGPSVDDTTDRSLTDANKPHEKEPTMHSSADRWKELCYGLIGALAAVTVLAVLYIVITQVRARHGGCKTHGVHDSERGLVYYHSAVPGRRYTEEPQMCVDARGVVHLEAQLRRNNQNKFWSNRIFKPTNPGHLLASSSESRRHPEHSPNARTTNEYVMDTLPTRGGRSHPGMHSIPEADPLCPPRRDMRNDPDHDYISRVHLVAESSKNVHSWNGSVER